MLRSEELWTLITLSVGKDEHVVTVPKIFLFPKSAVLEKMFETAPGTSENRTISLPEEDVSIMKRFEGWLGRSGLMFLSDPSPDELFDFVKLWIFAAEYFVTDLEEALFKKMSAFVKCHPNTISTEIFFAMSTSGRILGR